MTSRLGIITIGQSPRDDVVPAMTAKMGPGVEVVQKGALDGLTNDEVEALAPTEGQLVLCTRLADGGQAVISKERIIALVEARVDELNREGVDLILLLCTGQFPRFESRVLLISAQEIVDRCVEAVVDEQRKVGLVIPLPEQEEQSRRAMLQVTPNVAVVSASPYGDLEAFDRAGRELKSHRPDVVVLHCMGYNDKHRRAIKREVGVPVITANSIVSRIVSELLE